MRISHHIPLQHKTFRRPPDCIALFVMASSILSLVTSLALFCMNSPSLSLRCEQPHLIIKLMSCFPLGLWPWPSVLLPRHPNTSCHQLPSILQAGHKSQCHDQSMEPLSKHQSKWRTLIIHPCGNGMFLSGMGKIFSIVLVCMVFVQYLSSSDPLWQGLGNNFVSLNFCFLFTLFALTPMVSKARKTAVTGT